MTKLNILVIVPLVEERDYFYEIINGREGWTSPKHPRTQMSFKFKNESKEADVAVRTIDKMGHLEAVLAFNSAFNATSPELVILLGLAGSMNPNTVGLGDVVISNQIKTYTANKVGAISQNESDNPHYKFFDLPPREDINGYIAVDNRDKVQQHSYFRYIRDTIESPKVDMAISSVEHSLDEKALSQLDMSVIPNSLTSYSSMNRNRSIHYGWIFGSNYVIDSQEYRDYIIEKNTDQKYDIYRQLNEHDKCKWCDGELLAVDMESYGVLKAVEVMRSSPATEGGSNNLVGGIVVRGISDLAETKGATDRTSKNQIRRVAVQNAAKVTAQIIEKMDYRHIIPR